MINLAELIALGDPLSLLAAGLFGALAGLALRRSLEAVLVIAMSVLLGTLTLGALGVIEWKITAESLQGHIDDLARIYEMVVLVLREQPNVLEVNKKVLKRLVENSSVLLAVGLGFLLGFIRS